MQLEVGNPNPKNPTGDSPDVHAAPESPTSRSPTPSSWRTGRRPTTSTSADIDELRSHIAWGQV